MEPKTFRQRVPKAGGGWSWSVKDVRRVLYRLHELVAADSAKVVFIPEGGKDVSDWLDAGGSRERLIDLVKAAPVFQPPANRRAAPKLEKWGNIEPLGIPSVLPFPVGALPGVLADFVAAEAEATQTPPR